MHLQVISASDCSRAFVVRAQLRLADITLQH
jgi:hypothetical protein